ncbi:hypothetical protein E1176_12150 [Fulvivirga sp. RKSG066]|uniref:hypothetical protein n=1 Tax=Fulvivirga aurantia TaxID=2529383 RepID=UPI0012BBDECC|nr:hypothetical protein [Fulvivirga aurantia]MTI21774.1 hypothetical protein [Fulvivirga aurantia]
MMYRFSIFVTLLVSCALIPAKSQDHTTQTPNKRIALYLGHTLIPEVRSEKRFVIPSWGLDLDYWFNPKIGLGLHSDIELETFVIKSEKTEELERNYPLVLTLDALYSPIEGLILQVGPGAEVDRQKSFFLVRMGIEYEIQLTHHWDLSPTIFYDHRIYNFSTWTFSLGVGKRFN